MGATAALLRDVRKLREEALAFRREPPEARVAEFERAFRAIHMLVDPEKDEGGLAPVPDGVQLPTPAWTTAKLSPAQYAYVFSEARTNVNDSARRAFKSQGMLRRTTRAAITSRLPDGEFYLCGPTHAQAKERLWRPLVKLVPRWAIRGVSRSELRIDLWNGCFLRVAGLDVPERIEGGNWDGGGITEFGNCHPDVLEHVEPMMVRPGAWIDIEGTPEMSAVHYRRLSDDVASGKFKGAMRHHWSAEEVLHLWLGRKAAQEKLDDFKNRMPSRIYDQEMLGLWVVAGGRAYYAFDKAIHATRALTYDPNVPLILCFDFNVSPGCAVICQDQRNGGRYQGVDDWFTAAIDEVWIQDDSNTPRVMDQLLARWGSKHQGEVHLYGDPAGGARGTAAVDGSDWDIINQRSRAVWGNRVKDMVGRKAPPIRSRVNAVNARLKTADGAVRMLVDPAACPHVVTDLESVTWELIETPEKKAKAGDLSHVSDSLGYMIEDKHPMLDAAPAEMALH